MSIVLEQVEKLFIVIVIYDTDLSDSEAYNSLSECFTQCAQAGYLVDLMIVNNGPAVIDCHVDEKIFRLHFVERLDNPGVSEAYNIAGKLAKQLGKDWLLLLDQDTRLPTESWQHYSESISRYSKLPLHAPRLRADSLLVSPCGYSFYRGHILPSIDSGIHQMIGHNVLNSGLLISVDAFHSVGGYDENVQLYFSDFVFFDRLKTCYNDFAVVDLDLIHNLSSSDYSSLSKAISRFTLYCQGAYAAARGEIGRSILYFLTVGARSLVMGIRFKTWLFVRVFMGVWF